jgi:hypothetical protein
MEIMKRFWFDNTKDVDLLGRFFKDWGRWNENSLVERRDRAADIVKSC